MKPTTIEQYILGERNPIVQERLQALVECIREAAPGATESIKWSMPAFSYKRILVTFAVYEHHIGFYPTPSAIKAFAKSIAKYNSAKGSVQFPHNKPLPLALVSKITKFRVKESLEEDKKWKG